MEKNNEEGKEKKHLMFRAHWELQKYETMTSSVK